jgi:hypothetical protein
VNAGVIYGRPLSLSRRTSVSFNTGSAIAVNDRLDTPDADRRVRAHITGSAQIVHELGRTWTASATYTRGFRTRDGIADLFFTDAITTRFGGLFSRRLSFASAASWASSSLQNDLAGGRHWGMAASAQTTYAISRWLGAYARYVYYRHRYGDNVALDDRFSRNIDRQGVRPQSL